MKNKHFFTIILTCIFVICFASNVFANDDGLIIKNGILIKYVGNASEVIIPDNVTAIGKEAFFGCKNVKSIIIPQSVTSIGYQAFADTGLIEIVLPENLEEVDTCIFKDCSNLRRVTFPTSGKTVDTLRDWSTLLFAGLFYNCHELKEINNIPCSKYAVSFNRSVVPDYANENTGKYIEAQSDKVNRTAKEITAGLSSDYAKAKAIAEWVNTNIEYDYEKYDLATYPDNVLEIKSAVCAGFASLTKALLNAADIPAIIVGGTDIESGEGHAWNMAFVDGRWICMDTTWNMGYFDMAVAQFAGDHMPDNIIFVPANKTFITSGSGQIIKFPEKPQKGEVVTLTVIPDTGYCLESLTVTDSIDHELSISKKNDNQYEFIMPTGYITINATYTPIDNIGGVDNTEPELSKISGGNLCSYAVKNDGVVYAWGYTGSGILKNSKNNSSLVPVGIQTDFISICGNNSGSILGLKQDNTLWAWGRNDEGQLGDDTTVNKLEPVKILDNVRKMSISGSTSLAIKSDGSLWAWGSNHWGMFGNGTEEDSCTPVKVMDNVTDTAAGIYACFAIKSDGSLWAWGWNAYGQVGENRVGGAYPLPGKIMDNAIAVAANYGHTLAIKTDGSLWAWGSNKNGQLGDGTKETRYSPIKVMDDVAMISVGRSHSLALKNDGSVWSWGENKFGQLGDGTMVEHCTPVKVMEDVVSISAGADFSLAVTSDGTLWAWGFNEFGQLGDGTKENRLFPVKVFSLK